MFSPLSLPHMTETLRVGRWIAIQGTADESNKQQEKRILVFIAWLKPVEKTFLMSFWKKRSNLGMEFVTHWEHIYNENKKTKGYSTFGLGFGEFFFFSRASEINIIWHFFQGSSSNTLSLEEKKNESQNKSRNMTICRSLEVQFIYVLIS